MQRLIWLILVTLPLLTNAEDLKRVVDLRGYWKFSIGDNPRWSSPDYNDQSWEKIFVPSPWENEGFGGFDGYAWYRITVDLRNVNDKNLYLVLGYIDDVDQVYLNGQLIGFSGSFPPDFYTAYNAHRKYYIPEELINRNGKNVIAIRVFDTILEGGIIKGDVGIYSNKEIPKESYSLEGNWKFREGDSDAWARIDYEDDHWREIMVPSLWRSLKKANIEGTAWYRKTITITTEMLSEENLLLVMGRIDDFDETYLNGVLIGKTNDRKPFGWSESYRQLRTYSIPKNIVRPGQPNVIAVRVSDIGGDAGIYKGPLCIVPESKLDQVLRAIN
ncbi:beta galactosidase jelly roll domain-containing protein [Marinoscillum sp.]|uniref:beta galactosidase jelly roll domain-containing protein n=1 Tax=Marinoscillum sp. TaxID=2024838 RepID=UPI003BA94D4F